MILYHLLSEGRARVQVENSTRGTELSAGDIVVVPHGDAHIISNGSPTYIVDNGLVLERGVLARNGFLFVMVEEAKRRYSCADIWNAIANIAPGTVPDAGKIVAKGDTAVRA